MFLRKNVENSENFGKNGISPIIPPESHCQFSDSPSRLLCAPGNVSKFNKQKQNCMSCYMIWRFVLARDMVLRTLFPVVPTSSLPLGCPGSGVRSPAVSSCRRAVRHDRHRGLGQAGGRPGRAHTEEHGRGRGAHHRGQPQDSQGHRHPGAGQGLACLPPRKLQAILSWQKQFEQSDSVVKSRPANAGDTASIPGLGRSPGEGNGNPPQYSCLENPMDRGGWRATVRRVIKQSVTRLSNSATTAAVHGAESALLWAFLSTGAFLSTCSSLLRAHRGPPCCCPKATSLEPGSCHSCTASCSPRASVPVFSTSQTLQ